MPGHQTPGISAAYAGNERRRKDPDRMVFHREELKEILAEAYADGLTEGLRRIGLHDEEAADDIKSLRGLLSDWREVRSGAMNVLGRVLTFLLLGLILFAIGWKSGFTKWMGSGP